MSNYRERIFAAYATEFQEVLRFDEAEARRWGRSYDHFFRGWLPTDPDAAIADLGCGAGRLLLFFRDRGYRRSEGIDRSPQQVRLARQIDPAVREGDLLEFLAARPDHFDLLTTIDVIEHLHKDEVLAFLDHAHASLRPGGRLILQTPNADSPFGTELRYGDFTHETLFTPKVLAALLRLIGFVAPETRELGPVPWGYSLTSTIRAGLWQVIRHGLIAWNLIETGDRGSGVFSRVFAIAAQKPRR